MLYFLDIFHVHQLFMYFQILISYVSVALYETPEKPNNALDFLTHYMRGGPPESNDVETLKLEVSITTVL